MANRRIHMTINNKYVQPLGMNLSPYMIVTPNVDYNSIIFRNTQRFNTTDNLDLKIWAKLDGDTGENLHLKFFLFNGDKILSGGSCSFTIYAVSLDDSYSETEIFTGSGILQTDGSFIQDVPYSSFSIPTDMDGERTLLVKASIPRKSTVFKNKEYFNHIGIYDSFIRLRNKVNFLAITKKDFGMD